MRFTLQCGVLIMPKFTKGEWFIENYSSMLDVAAKGHGSICTVECGYQLEEMLIDPTDEEQANAHLIAAAPDMYKLLDELKRHMDLEYSASPDEWIDDINKLLSKAKGES